MKTRRSLPLILAGLLAPGAALAAGSNTGVEAGFFALGTDLNTILTGAGGFVILIVSVLIGGAVWAFTGRMQWVVAAAGVALFLGYGVTVLTSLSGVTATTGMIAGLETPVFDPAGQGGIAEPLL